MVVAGAGAVFHTRNSRTACSAAVDSYAAAVGSCIAAVADCIAAVVARTAADLFYTPELVVAAAGHRACHPFPSLDRPRTM